jgi:hypothetical protein
MAEGVDLSALPPNVPSLCIPRVFKNITRERVFNCFKDLGIGFVERIDMVPRKAENGDEFQRVFVHLRWNRTDQAAKARSRVLAGKEIKIVYDEPWFWKVSANRSVSRDQARDSNRRESGPGDRSRATLALEDDDLEGNIRHIKAQNDRDRKGGRQDNRGPRRDQASRGARGPRQHRVAVVPRSPSSSPPRPAEVLEPLDLGVGIGLGLAAAVPDLAPTLAPTLAPVDDSFNVDAPTTAAVGGQSIDYGSEITIVKKKKVVGKGGKEKEKEKEKVGFVSGFGNTF